MTFLLSVATRSMAYGFYVGGVQITSSNYTDIIGAIKNADADRITVLSGGSITYVPASKTLTLKNVTITRKGSKNRGITNDSETNLNVIFEGTVKLDAQDASPILCTANTTLKCANGGKVELYSSNSDGLTANGCTITIQDADMSITSNSKLGIMSDNDNGYVTITDSKVTVTGKTGAVAQLKELQIWEASTVTFNGNSSAVTVHDLQDFVLDEYDMKIDSPTGAYYSSTKKAIVTSTYPNGYTGTIKFITTAMQVNATNFPDTNFRSYISSTADKNGDGYLTATERLIVTDMSMQNRSIHDLTGIGYFPALESLDCSFNSLGELTLPVFEELKELSCIQCGLSRLTIYLPSLTKLNCTNNVLTSQPVTTAKTPNLETFVCAQNIISGMDLSGLTKLKEVNCYFNMMTSLNVSGCTALTKLVCNTNQLNSLDVTGCTNLTNLNCSSNQLTSLNVNGLNKLNALDCSKNQLTSLYVYNCWGLKELQCYRNQLGNLTLPNLSQISSTGTVWLLNAYDTNEGNHVSSDRVTDWQDTGWTVKVHYGEIWYDVNDNMIQVNSTYFPDTKFRNYLLSQTYGSNSWLSYKEILGVTNINVNNKSIANLKGIERFIELRTLDCGNNSLSTLDVTKNLSLNTLICNNNGLNSLDLTKNLSLFFLTCSANNLSSLDLSNCHYLQNLKCDDNKLTSLKVNRDNNNVPLTSVYCQNNKLSASAMQTILSKTGNTNCSIYVQDWSSGREENVFNEELLALAKSNKWIPYYRDVSGWHLYNENSFVTGIDAATALEETIDGDALRYNLQGQRVGKDYHGVVIVNGRKVRVK